MGLGIWRGKPGFCRVFVHKNRKILFSCRYNLFHTFEFDPSNTFMSSQLQHWLSLLYEDMDTRCVRIWFGRVWLNLNSHNLFSKNSNLFHLDMDLIHPKMADACIGSVEKEIRITPEIDWEMHCSTPLSENNLISWLFRYSLHLPSLISKSLT